MHRSGKDLFDIVPYPVLLVTDIIFSLVILILHTAGLYLLRNVHQGKFNVNNMIVTCLSGTEISYSIACMACDIIVILGHYNAGVFLVEFMAFIVNPMIHYIIVLITLNRFVGCVYPIFYRRYVTKNFARITAISVSVVGVVIGVGV